MAIQTFSQIDGMGYDDPQSGTKHPGLLSGRKFKFLGQTGNTVAGNVANQGGGTVAVPALTAGQEATVTVTDNLITTTSLIFVTTRRGTTTPGAGALGAVVACAQAPASGSCVIDVSNRGTVATLSTDYQLWYEVVN